MLSSAVASRQARWVFIWGSQFLYHPAQIINGLFGGWIVKHTMAISPIYAIVLAGFA